MQFYFIFNIVIIFNFNLKYISKLENTLRVQTTVNLRISVPVSEIGPIMGFTLASHDETLPIDPYMSYIF